MSSSNPLREQAFQFALHIVNFCKDLNNEREYIISKQLLRSGTSIGANLEESVSAQSTADYLSKFSISHKESHETDFWLRLLHDSNILPKKAQALRGELHSIRKMLASSIMTLKKKSKL